MADGIKIEIVAPERLLVSAEARSVTVPGAEGYFTVLGDHSPVITSLKPGFITVTSDGGSEVYYVRAGFAEVSAKGVTILAEQALPMGEFNRSDVDEALEKARATLAVAANDEHRSEAEQMVMSLENFINEMTTYTPANASH